MASKRRIRRKSCAGKVRHQNQTDAVASLKGTVKRNNLNRYELRTYKCKFCHCWHIGHPNKDVKKRIESAI